MSRARHVKRAAGGKATVYAGEGSNVLKEAEERRKGGRVEHMEGEGEKAKGRHDRPKRARGGKIEHHGKVEHEHSGEVVHKHRAKGGRIRGEGVGANLTPLSTASKIKEVVKGEEPEDAEKD